MRVELARLAEQRARLGARASTSESDERPGVGEPGGVPVAGVGGEQLLELVVGLECQQPVRLPVAQPPGYRRSSAVTAHDDARPPPRGAPDATASRRAPRGRVYSRVSKISQKSPASSTNTRRPTERSPAAAPR